jgi:hypothetical protein
VGYNFTIGKAHNFAKNYQELLDIYSNHLIDSKTKIFKVWSAKSAIVTTSVSCLGDDKKGYIV